MKKILTISFAVLFTAYTANAQNIFPATGAAGIGTNAPNASSLLEIKSTTKGFLPPRMTIAQRNAIATPATGLMIYQINSTAGFYYYDGSAWTAMKPKNNSWSLTGNSGTVAGTNFIGTTDAQNLVFKVNNQSAGFIENDAVKATTAYGFQTLNSNTTGTNNTAYGYTALKQNTTGYGNTAAGTGSLFSSTTGYNNTANGYYALYSNNAGFSNTATGTAALYINTSGSYNTATGGFALNLNTTGSYNTATGISSLLYNTTGNNNTGTGYQSLYNNTTGSWNTANGDESLFANTTGYFNTATGYFALNKNTTGDRNAANGCYALSKNTSGRLNAAIGVDAMFSNTTGSSNVANGFEALHNNTTGYSNVALGVDALYSNVIGSNNVAIGDSALYNSSPLFYNYSNTAIGSKALFNNSSGYENTAIGIGSQYGNTTGYYNTSVGDFALGANENGYQNVAVGLAALRWNDGGVGNVAVGNDALYLNNGSYNTALGNYTLYNAFPGNYTTALGAFADFNNDNLSNATAVGANALATASNQVMLGSTTINSVKAAGNFVIYSDGRFKKNIKENVPGLEFINQLKPVTYNYDIHKLNDFIQPDKKINTLKDKLVTAEKKSTDAAEKIKEEAIAAKEKKIYTGFVAQDVEKVADKMGYDFSGVYKPQNDKDPYGISYADFVVPLVKAVQELSAKNDDLQKQINELKAGMSSASQAPAANGNTQIIKLTGPALLAQNIPNPFINSTTINYTLPQQYSKAKIIVADKTGRTLKEINISGNGKGSVQIDAALIAAGVYSYSLYIDDKLKESKQMIITK